MTSTKCLEASPLALEPYVKLISDVETQKCLQETYTTIGLVAHDMAHTGNKTTILRIASGLRQCGHSVYLYSANDDCLPILINDIKNSKVDILIGLHAYRAGLYILRAREESPDLSYAVILGGTDVNEMAWEPEKAKVMSECLRGAKALIGFNHSMLQIAQTLISFGDGEETRDGVVFSHVTSDLSLGIGRNEDNRPHTVYACDDRQKYPMMYVIPQAVALHDIEVSSIFDLHNALNIPDNHFVFLLITSIRVVKDPLYIIESFEKWHQADSTVHLCISGPEIDVELSKHLQRAIQRCEGVHYIGTLPHDTIPVALRQATAVVNTSKSEGMSAAILEAMAMGKPVFARHNAGNAAIVRHNSNGYLFHSPEEFVELGKALVGYLSPLIRASSGLPSAPLSGPVLSSPERAGKSLATSCSPSSGPLCSQSRSEANNLFLTPPETIIANAQQYICAFHSTDAEIVRYNEVVQHMVHKVWKH